MQFLTKLCIKKNKISHVYSGPHVYSGHCSKDGFELNASYFIFINLISTYKLFMFIILSTYELKRKFVNIHRELEQMEAKVKILSFLKSVHFSKSFRAVVF